MDKVVWIFFEGNDILDLKFEKKNLILKNYLNNENFTQRLKFKQEKINTLNNQVILNEKKFYFKNLIKLGNLRAAIKKIITSKENNFAFGGDLKDEDIFEFLNIIHKAKKFSDENNLDFYFVYLPDTNRTLNAKYNNKTYNVIKNELKKFEIEFIDLKTAMFDKNDNFLDYFPFRQINHFNEIGYEKMSKEIYKFIYENNY